MRRIGNDEASLRVWLCLKVGISEIDIYVAPCRLPRIPHLRRFGFVTGLGTFWGNRVDCVRDDQALHFCSCIRDRDLRSIHNKQKESHICRLWLQQPTLTLPRVERAEHPINRCNLSRALPLVRDVQRPTSTHCENRYPNECTEISTKKDTKVCPRHIWHSEGKLGTKSWWSFDASTRDELHFPVARWRDKRDPFLIGFRLVSVNESRSTVSVDSTAHRT